MTRSDLIERLSRKFPALTAADVTAAAKVILTAMADTLEEGGRIEIRGFGSFGTNVRPPSSLSDLNAPDGLSDWQIS